MNVQLQRERIIADCETSFGSVIEYRSRLRLPVYKLARLKRSIAVTSTGVPDFRINDLTMGFRYIEQREGSPFVVKCYSVRTHGFVTLFESDLDWLEKPEAYRTQMSENSPIATEEDIAKAKEPPCKHEKVTVARSELVELEEAEWPTTIKRYGICCNCGRDIEITYVALSQPRPI